MKSKLRKALSHECNKLFSKYLTEDEVKQTENEVKAYASNFDECTVDCLREEKKYLNNALNNLIASKIIIHNHPAI